MKARKPCSHWEENLFLALNTPLLCHSCYKSSNIRKNLHACWFATMVATLPPAHWVHCVRSDRLSVRIKAEESSSLVRRGGLQQSCGLHCLSTFSIKCSTWFWFLIRTPFSSSWSQTFHASAALQLWAKAALSFLPERSEESRGVSMEERDQQEKPSRSGCFCSVSLQPSLKTVYTA